MKIYTKTGDTGETNLLCGARITKAHPRIEAYGTVDELNACLGIAIADGRERNTGINVERLLRPIQRELFIIGSHLATQCEPSTMSKSIPPLKDDAVQHLEHEIDELSESLPPLKNFILPGGTTTGAHLHLARTVCRRAERAVIRLSQNEEIPPIMVRYLNRLSDYLFVLARAVNADQGASEETWEA
ncbi:MAG: cob(I)yrinic acid a,c-diamide adenosyltransferase [Candidatus Kerfeldbacteria bacterium]